MSRPDTLALKPAPIVASYLGYPGTVGAAHTDYTIADRVRDRTVRFLKPVSVLQMNQPRLPAKV